MHRCSFTECNKLINFHSHTPPTNIGERWFCSHEHKREWERVANIIEFAAAGGPPSPARRPTQPKKWWEK